MNWNAVTGDMGRSIAAVETGLRRLGVWKGDRSRGCAREGYAGLEALLERSSGVGVEKGRRVV